MIGPYSHITLGTDDIARAMAFYDVVLPTLGWTRVRTRKTAFAFAPKDWDHIEPPFWVLRPADRQPARAGNGAQVSFHAPHRAAVDAFHAAALAAGGTDEGPPGLRTHYHPNFYAAYLRDLDGNKLLAVCHEAPGSPRLVTTARFADPDAAYAALVDARRDLSGARAADLDARLVLILANHIGDPQVLAEAIALARGTLEGT
jgi:catechol 2,3-dioxygenase-like lactoylglutathione lyase family enzyme